MKTTTVARGFIGAVASLLGVVAVGCSADGGWEGAAGEGEIGSVEQALTAVASKAALSSARIDFGGADLAPDPVAREFAASCEITDNGSLAMLLVGGFDRANGIPLGDAYLYRPDLNEWAQVNGLPQGEERGHAKLIQVASDKCLLVGGSGSVDGSTPTATTYLFTAHANGDDEGAWAAAGAIEGRTFHDVFKCGSANKVMVVGGHSGSGFQNPISGSNKAFQLWNGSNAWSDVANLGTPVSGFALAVKDSTKIALVGGVPASAEATNIVQAYTLSNDANCTVTANGTNTIKLASNPATAITGRYGAAAFFNPLDSDSNANTDDLFLTAGTEVTTAPARSNPTDLEKFVVTWGTGVGAMSQVSASGFSVATRFPSIAIGNGKVLLVGGEDASAVNYLESTPVNALQEITPAASPTNDTSFTGTAPTLLGSAVSYLDGSVDKYYVATGRTAFGTPPTTTAAAHEITP